MRHAGAARKALGVRTAFNLLGPLTNPAGATRQLVGVPRPEFTELMARSLLLLGSTGPGSSTAPTGSTNLDDRLHEDFGVPRRRGQHVLPASRRRRASARRRPARFGAAIAADNARIIERVLAGERGPARDIVLLNAGAALLIAGEAGIDSRRHARGACAIDRGGAAARDARAAGSTARARRGGAP